ncbi:heavy-metal-associated domain-containing protein [Marinilabilia salmonicolor]|uniref:Heavy-metal-associated domain-containing protein n=1 Tax=Marinilabilia salmonicolor TaxID=989 RepID=A0A368VD97_9BACT|nr:heavy metal-associated domain-containing protein [Marinilabilia salmonicolor]RCW39092.1 heavy-metal-associated domain-containing protein [Marinilabilia salmonicolor]
MKQTKNKLTAIAILFILSATSIEAFAEIRDYQSFAVEQDSTKQHKFVTYEVFGMDCPGCQSALEKQVNKIDGVAGSKASFKKKLVEIELKPDAKVADEEIEKRIKKANFTPGKKIKPQKDEK